MSQFTNAVAGINDILDPVLFQVVGSTPITLRDAVKEMGLKNNPSLGAKMVAISIFAAAVNKSTMENLLLKEGLSDARSSIRQNMSISGNPNMTALTLFGHCAMLDDISDSVQFAQHYRSKMGQNNLWDGELKNGSLSEKQREILGEKKKVLRKDECKMFISCFMKFSGIRNVAMSSEEARFWGDNGTGPGSGLNVGRPEQTETKSPPRTGQRHGSASNITPPSGSPPRDLSGIVRGSSTDTVTLSNGRSVQIPSDIASYYLEVNKGDVKRLVASIERKGVQQWIDDYRQASKDDPNRRAEPGAASTVG